MGYRQKVRPIFNQNGLSGRLYFPAGSARPRCRERVLSWVIGKIRSRLSAETGCLEDYIFRRAPRCRDPRKSPLTYTWQKIMGVFGKKGPFRRIYFRRASSGSDPANSPPHLYLAKIQAGVRKNWTFGRNTFQTASIVRHSKNTL